MASTVGHALCGVACLLGARLAAPRQAPPLDARSIVLFILLANLPDFDLALGYALGDTHRFHGGGTHSIAFAALAGLVAAPALRAALGWLHAWMICALTVLSHVLVDALVGPQLGRHASLGARFFWPWIDEPVGSLPFTVLLGIRHDSIISLHSLKAVALELAMFVPVLGLLWALELRRRAA